MRRSLLAVALLPACTPMPELHFNEPPGPPAFHIEPFVPTTTDALVVTLDSEAVDPEDDDIEYSWTWYADGEEYSTGVGRTLDPAATRKGQVWEVVGTATDGEFVGAEARGSVTIANAPPAIASVSLSPSLPDTTDDLVLLASGEDADGDLIAWRVVWSKDGVAQSAYADLLTLPADATGSQEEWSAVVTPFDGTDVGASETLAVYIDNTPPTVTGVTLLPSAPTVDDAIGATVSGSFDPDPGQTVNVTFTWYVDGAEVMTETSSTGASYLSEGFVKGDQVSVVATPNDGYVDGDPVVSSIVTVVNTPPVLDGVTLTPTTGYEATTFECVPGASTDADGDRVSYDYTWYVDGVAISASDDTLTGSSFAKGDEIYCVVTPEDPEEAGGSVTSDTAVVLNTLPTITGVGLSPTAPTVASPISASVTGPYDADGDSISYTYAWTVNGVASGGSTSQLSNTAFDRGDFVQVTITPSDGSAGTALTSSAVEVVNAIPTLSSASITPNNPYNDDDLAVVVSGFSDADGDSAEYSYQWYKNSAALTGATSLTLDESYTTKGDRFYCAVTPSDGIDDGTVRNTPTVTILNSPPVAEAYVTSGTTATECDTIELDASLSTDEDGDSFSYTWSLASKPSASYAVSADIDATTDMAPTFQVDAEGTFTFGLNVSDGSTSTSDSVSVTVYDDPTNTEPVASAGDDDSDFGYGACSLNGTNWVCSPCSGTTFTIDASSSYDDEGDPLHYIWSTTSGYGSIASSTAESTTVRMQNMPAVHGVTTTYTAAVRLRVVDCAGNVSEDYVTLTFECIGT